MARKKPHEEHENHERWLISYADFITLLFAFFVVMYSLSSVNEGKYRVLADSMIAAFESSPSVTQPIDLGKTQIEKKLGSKLRQASMQSPNPGKTVTPNPVKSPLQPVGKSETSPFEQPAVTGTPRGNIIEKIESELQRAMAPLLSNEIIHLRSSDAWLEVEIREDILFKPGGARLHPKSIPVLDELANIFLDIPNAIQVEGFTDDVLIGNDEFPTNWELSAARSASVVRLFASRGIDPKRMAAVGYAQYQPISKNDTPEGRKRNNRIVIVLSANDTPRKIKEQPKPEPEKQAKPAQKTPGEVTGETIMPVPDIEKPKKPLPKPIKKVIDVQPPLTSVPSRVITGGDNIPVDITGSPIDTIKDFPIITPPINSPLLPRSNLKLLLPPKPVIAPRINTDGDNKQ